MGQRAEKFLYYSTLSAPCSLLPSADQYDDDFAGSVHPLEENPLDVAGHARAGDEDELAGQGRPAGRPYISEDFFDDLLIDGEDSIDGHDGDMQDRGGRNQPGLILIENEALSLIHI